jgi:hypothetical protein
MTMSEKHAATYHGDALARIAASIAAERNVSCSMDDWDDGYQAGLRFAANAIERFRNE